MIEYLQLATDAEVDAFRAEAWVRFYEDAIDRWIRYAKLPEDQLPLEWLLAGKPIPEYGDPLDFATGLGRLRWTTQACPGIVVHPLVAGGALVKLVGSGNEPSLVRKWASAPDIVTIPDARTLLSVRTLGMDASGTRARALLGFGGSARIRPTKTLASCIVGRSGVRGRWRDKLHEIEVGETARLARAA